MQRLCSGPGRAAPSAKSALTAPSPFGIIQSIALTSTLAGEGKKK